MAMQTSRRGSDQSQTMSNSPQQRPIIDSRSSSVTEAGIHRLDNNRGYGSVSEQTLVEEDEGPRSNDAQNPRARSNGEVRTFDKSLEPQPWKCMNEDSPGEPWQLWTPWSFRRPL